MKLLHVIVLLAAIAVITSSVVVLLHVSKDTKVFALDRAYVEYFFTVDTISGIDVADDMLRLGAVAPFTVNKRHMDVSHPEASKVYVFVRGDGAGILTSEFPVYDLVNGSAQVLFLVAPTNQTPLGNYSGVVEFAFVR